MTQIFHLLNNVFALLVQGQKMVEIQVYSPGLEGLPDVIRVFLHEFEIKHEQFLGSG
jgi:hypothetical protein